MKKVDTGWGRVGTPEFKRCLEVDACKDQEPDAIPHERVGGRVGVSSPGVCALQLVERRWGFVPLSLICAWALQTSIQGAQAAFVSSLDVEDDRLTIRFSSARTLAIPRAESKEINHSERLVLICFHRDEEVQIVGLKREDFDEESWLQIMQLKGRIGI